MRRCLALLVLLHASAALAAPAHLTPPDTGLLAAEGNGATFVGALPVAAFEGFDDDKDSLLSPAELDAHRDALKAAARDLVELRSDATPGKVVSAELELPHAEGEAPEPSTHVVLTLRAAWDAPPRELVIDARYLERAPGTLDLTLSNGGYAIERTLDAECRTQRVSADGGPATTRVAVALAALLIGGAAFAARRASRAKRAASPDATQGEPKA